MCKEKYIHVFTDFGFKRMFGSPANKKFLISFLNSLIQNSDPIVDITYENVEKLGMFPGDRNAIFDLYCTTESGVHVIVEMQNAYQRYFMDRSIFYSTFPMHEMARKGEWDFNLPKVYTIAFLNFRMQEFVDDPNYKHVIKLCDTATKEVFYDKLTYIYLEMPKFSMEIEELDSSLQYWLYVIKNMHMLERLPEKLKDKVFKEFFRQAEIEGFTREERYAYEESLKHMRDYNNTLRSAEEIGFEKGLEEGREKGLEEGREKGLEEGREKGLEEGREKGRQEGRREVQLELARRMLAEGLPVSQVASITGIDPSDINALLTTNKH